MYIDSCNCGEDVVYCNKKERLFAFISEGDFLFSRINSVGIYGMDAFMVEVEADANMRSELPQFNIVGLPDAAVKEARDRVRSAMKNSQFEFPPSKVIVNLAPADVKKSGALYDLPILMSILASFGRLNTELLDAAFIGELSLEGSVKPADGMLPMAICAKENGIKRFFVPADNAAECCVVEGIEIYPVKHALQLVNHLLDIEKIPVAEPIAFEKVESGYVPDFSEVKGQHKAKKAMEIAAAGGHNVLLVGPPGSGKSMLSKRLPSILPPLSFEEAIDTTKIYSIAGILPKETPIIKDRPFRSPHHSATKVGLAGGGTIPRPGEISLAHNGVLFLDELPEFTRTSMETLRQPLEDGVVTISRAAGTLSYPCTMTLVAAMNPCPCGYYGHPTKQCTCSESKVRRYLGKVSGPLLDRLDLQIEVPPVEFDALNAEGKEETSAQIRDRVIAAREIQYKRYKGTGITCNARLTPRYLNEFCKLDEEATNLLRSAFDALGMSGRSYDRILKVARTIADLDGSEDIKAEHLALALQFRSLDRKYF